MAGIEVEGIETTGCNVPNVVVAQINSSEQHPNADRLSVCQVDDGPGSARQIVCGAKNYKVGDKVPLALPGAKLRAISPSKWGNSGEWKARECCAAARNSGFLRTRMVS
jgi:tRNA-binding EMAP/Myf-like protein